MERNPHSPSHVFRQETGIDITYGEKTWRPIQSVIDIVQNHLDAHTKDRSLPLPQIKLRVQNGVQTQLVDYDEVKQLPDEWVVQGFRIYDMGTGYDNKLLSMMGATTKDRVDTRGGLGEGLKMSIAHLVRNGVDIRLYSRNLDHVWVAHPLVDNQTLVFKGRMRENGHTPFTGSITDINFGTSEANQELKDQLTTELDPRKGEGLGKYVLDYRGKKFRKLVTTDCDLTKHGIPGGRAYVRGLLVELNEEFLNSYNLKDSSSIAGRDRKTVKTEELKKVIKDMVQRMKKAKDVESFFEGLLAGNTPYVESMILNGHLQLDDPAKEIWRETIRNLVGYEPGKVVLDTSYTSLSDQRYAQDRGYEVKAIPDQLGGYNFISLVNYLYPDQIITMRDLRDQMIDVSTSLSNRLTRPLLKGLEAFIELTGLDRLKRVTFAASPAHSILDASGSRFRYEWQDNALLVDVVRPNISPNEYPDYIAELTKLGTGSTEFDQTTQALLTRLAARGLIAYSPDLLDHVKLPRLQEKQKVQGEFISYPHKQRRADDLTLHYFDILKLFNSQKTTIEQITEAMAILKGFSDVLNSDLKDSVSWFNINRPVTETFFYINGDVYRIDLPSGYQLKKVSLSRSTDQKSRPTLLKEDTASVTLRYPGTYFLPYQLADGESKEIAIHADGFERTITVFRDREGIIKAVIKDQDNLKTTITLRNNHCTQFANGKQMCAVEVGNNVLMIKMRSPFQLDAHTVSEESERSDQQEVNRGSSFIRTHMTVDYGKDVWSNPQRVLLDAIQNHLDADSSQAPRFRFSVADRNGNIRHVNEEDMMSLDREWRIFGITIEDSGKGYTTPYLSILGRTTKGEQDRGKFGEGLKLLVASCVNQGIHVRLRSRDWEAKPKQYSESVKNYETGETKAFNMLGYDMKWLDCERSGSQTMFQLFELDEDAVQLTSQQLALLSLSRTTKGDWSKWREMLDPRFKDHGDGSVPKLVVSKEDYVVDGPTVKIVRDSTALYEKQLLIPHRFKAPALFGYDIHDDIVDTRERNHVNEDKLTHLLTKFYGQLEDIDTMIGLLTSIRDNPGLRFLENVVFEKKTFAGDRRLILQHKSLKSSILWRKAFYQVFGDSSVLSLATTMHHPMHAVVNEVHIPKDRIRYLPAGFSDFFEDKVANSEQHFEASERESIDLSVDDRNVLFSSVQFLNDRIAKFLLDPQVQRHMDTYTKQRLLFKCGLLKEINADDLTVLDGSSTINGSVSVVKGRIHVNINEFILNDPIKFVGTYLHEVCHFLSDAHDFHSYFQEVMALFASYGISPYYKTKAKG